MGWSELVILASPLAVLETYASDPKVYLGLIGLDLTEFFTNCALSIYCQNYKYEARYDGFAMIGELNLGDLTATADPSANDDEATIVNCIEVSTERYSCWGLELDALATVYVTYLFSGVYVKDGADIMDKTSTGGFALPYAEF